ncbi:putative WRKY transcription factor 19 [Phytophthora citrophthora]|uniref:WRKY transcription factor 19 n=1 Tax=Phytophthora citrophthora TaxID=4793 RepID=A0AAD9GQ67_9STRA|nr:putative WRKY transcription factor 19 [Phytophthora citrophthora]
MCKADISFLLNPSGPQAPTTPERTPMSPSLSPLMNSPECTILGRRRLEASYIAPLEKRRCYGLNKRAFPAMSMAALCSECFSSSDDEQSDASSAPSTTIKHPRKTHTPPCQVEGCKNLAVSRGCCVRHGGGSKCTEPGCNKRAKLYQRCFQHGGYKMCTEPGCTKKAKRYGHCWSHGGGHICEAPECTKVSTQGGFCWAHGGGNRCKHEGCNRRSYQKYDYYCQRHAKTA